MYKISGLRNIWIFVLSLAVAGSLFGASSKNKTDDKSSDKLKSDYIFMEALRHHERDSDDAYFDLISRAHELDPSNSELAFYRGYYGFMISNEDSIAFNEGYNLMKSHFNQNPSEFYNNFVYGSINDRIGQKEEALRVWGTLDSVYPTKTEVALKLAEALAASRDSANIAKSIGVYDRIEKSQGKNIPISSRKIRAYIATRDTASIFDEVAALLKASPRSIEYNVFAGDIYSMFSSNDSALYYYDRACEIDSTSGLACYARANFYKTIGDSIGYDREVFRALTRESLDLNTKLELMTSYIRALYENPAQQPRIQELFASLLDQHPHEVDIHELYYSYLMAIQDYSQAAEQLGYAIDIDPSQEERWGTLMTLYIQDNNYEKSAETAEKALHYFPDNSTFYHILGVDYVQLKEYDKALTAFDTAISKLDPADFEERSQITTAIGDLYYSKNEVDSAFAFYDKAIEIDPDNLLALNNCAYYLAVEGRDLDRAETMSVRTIREKPDDATSLDTYAWVMFKKKNYVEAQAYIEKAIANSEELSEELCHHAGDIYFMNGDPKKALEYWEQALEYAPDNELLKRKVKHKTYFYE